jgi:tRNA modification GTPase
VNGDTIFALASGHGRSAVAVIRLSGPGARTAVADLAGTLPEPRRASLRRLRDPATGETLDEALVLWLPGPHSYTGEDGAELHIHGGLAVRSAVIRVLATRPGLRPAEPGEFTRRAFLNGRMDLSAVEGLADLIDAETEAQRRQAFRQLEGALARKVADWRERLLDAAALIEAGLDFTDEDDVPADVAAGALNLLTAVATEVSDALAGSPAGERLREGFTVVIAGPPNAGKSTLLNAIAGRDVAIVSPFAGTTRDAIEIRCDLDGLPVVFVDTAGLRDTADPVEAEGIARARHRAENADLVLALQPVDEDVDPQTWSTQAVPVRTKLDLGGEVGAGELAVSAASGAGLDSLLGLVRARAEAALGAGDALATRARHRRALDELAEALSRAISAGQGTSPELVAEDLRVGLRALGRITGQVDVEDVLDRVFGQFCIGK